MTYLWVKALHVIFVVTWFAGLFYLPRLFVYHADARDDVGSERFKIMERRLYLLMTMGATLTAAFGVALLAMNPGLLQAGWVHAKLALLAGLVFYHVWCGRLVSRFRDGRNVHSSKWYRAFNEVPTLFLFGIVILAIVKPF
ncbi:MAG: protoporphyrinogen oxidase HemJ [Steroidobacteraceae bacterium]|jgi:putative membrane protein|nr:protoporphyrinogen oxidase HemJ [Steroidobacteraceae bacterium]